MYGDQARSSSAPWPGPCATAPRRASPGLISHPWVIFHAYIIDQIFVAVELDGDGIIECENVWKWDQHIC